MNKMCIFGGVSAALVLAASGCETKEAPKPAPPKGADTTPPNKTVDAVNDAAAAVDSAAKDAKDKAVAAAQDLYDSAKRELDELAAKVSSSSSLEKPLWERAVDGVKSQFGEAERKLGDLKADNTDWERLSGEFSTLMTRAREGLKSLASQVK
jgi:hypothetical protein